MKSLTIAAATAVALGFALPAHAAQITLGASGGPAYDLASMGTGILFSNSAGFYAEPTIGPDGDVATAAPYGAQFGPTSFMAGPQVNGVFPVISGGGEILSISFSDGDTATGTAQLTEIDDGSVNPHLKFTWNVTSKSGDAAWLAFIGNQPLSGEYIFSAVPIVLDEFATAPGDMEIFGSAGQLINAPLPEASTLAIFGALLIAGGCWFQGRNRGGGGAAA